MFRPEILKDSILWAVSVLFFTIIPVLSIYIYESFQVNGHFDIIEYLKNGTVIIVAVGISSASWMDLIFENKTQQSKWLHIAPVIILFISVICVISLTSLEKENVNKREQMSLLIKDVSLPLKTSLTEKIDEMTNSNSIDLPFLKSAGWFLLVLSLIYSGIIKYKLFSVKYTSRVGKSF